MTERELLIRVRENPFKPLLDRENVSSQIGTHLRPWTDLTADLANYGSMLIPRSFDSSPRLLKDAVVLGILLRQVVAMLDAIEVLLRVGAVHAANLDMRALFEASVYIDFMLLGDSEKKAQYYYVHNLRRKRLWATRTQSGGPESGDFAAMLSKYGLTITDQQRHSEKLRIDDIDRVLSQPVLATISRDVEKHRKGKRDPAWYVPLGEKNLATMSRTVDKSALYAFLYSGASEVMHSSSYDQHIKMGKSELTSHPEITFQPIRTVEGFETVLRFSLNVALPTFRRVLEEYRPGELPLFGRKYMENWQKEFLNFPKIEFKVETTRI